MQKNGRDLRFKAHVTEAVQLAEGRQENDWARVMTTKLSLAGWKNGSEVKNTLTAWTGMQAEE